MQATPLHFTHLANLCSSSFRQEIMPDCFSTAKESVESGFPPVSSARRNVLKVHSFMRVSFESTCKIPVWIVSTERSQT